MSRRALSRLHRAGRSPSLLWPRLSGRMRGLLAGVLLSGASGCLLEQNLGYDTPSDLAAPTDFAVTFDLLMPRPDVADLAELRDLLPPPDRAMPPDLACPLERTSCDGVCKNLLNDPMNCGACKTACSAIQICVMGKCDACPKEQSACENHCTPLGSDVNNCGKCGNVCPMGKACVMGVCAL